MLKLFLRCCVSVLFLWAFCLVQAESAYPSDYYKKHIVVDYFKCENMTQSDPTQNMYLDDLGHWISASSECVPGDNCSYIHGETAYAVLNNLCAHMNQILPSKVPSRAEQESGIKKACQYYCDKYHGSSCWTAGLSSTSSSGFLCKNYLPPQN